ncbi:uncharacterized protein N7482_004266 [Penicillium canariense]|uniref:Uncharacterized protein n=1 Tax=Penicillium canariense TaxID=189055 RepID=A0A9W9LPF0_9EURO|nr:uncharacterized protein N7482_004266 [Penicillium canariense]KAJ5168672.1 hypothetical protein N7482_004266 [Penicillium canariense]
MAAFLTGTGLRHGDLPLQYSVLRPVQAGVIARSALLGDFLEAQSAVPLPHLLIHASVLRMAAPAVVAALVYLSSATSHGWYWMPYASNLASASILPFLVEPRHRYLPPGERAMDVDFSGTGDG